MPTPSRLRVDVAVSDLVIIECGADLHPGEAVVWNPQTGELSTAEHVCGGCESSATDEELAAARAELVRHIRAQLQHLAEAEAQRPGIGRRVKVVRGRKPPPGLVGVVAWAGENQFASEDAAYPFSYGVTVEEDPTETFEPGERVFGSESVSGRPRFEVVDPSEYMPDPAELDGRAERIAAWSWWTPFVRSY